MSGEGPNPSGFCMCGCGALAPLSRCTERSKGYIAGQPVRYIPGHQTRLPPEKMQPPNPSGLCMCGCGRKTRISTYTSLRDGCVEGEHGRFLRGHATRLNPKFAEARARVHQRNRERASSRRRRVWALYSEGVTHKLISRMLNLDPVTVSNDVTTGRRLGLQLPRHRESLARHYTDTDVEWIEAAWADGIRLDDIAARFGWTRQQVTEIFRRLRREGRSLPLRYAPDICGPYAAEGITLDRRSLGVAYRKANVRGQLPDDWKVLLRLMQAAERPVTTATLRALVDLLGRGDLAPRVMSLLPRMLSRSLVERVESTPRRYRWFIPFDEERPRGELTLADAERETELAALIREQDDDIERGHWAQVAGTVSLDAPIGEDGGSLHDVLRSRR